MAIKRDDIGDQEIDDIMTSNRLVTDKLPEADAFVEGVIDEMIRLSDVKPSIQDIDIAP